MTGFDTLAMARTLRNAGFDERQSEAIADAVRAAVTEDLVAKAGLRAEITRLEVRLVARMVGLAMLSVGLIIGVLRFL